MRTTVGLDSVTALVEGRHEDPFSILGPHLIDEGGRRMLGVRAFLPHAKQAWVVAPGAQHLAADAANPPGRLVRGDLPRSGNAKGASPICCALPTIEGTR